MSLLAVFVVKSNTIPIKGAVIPFNVTYFDTPPGLYFEETATGYVTDAHWNVLSFVNLKIFHDEYQVLHDSAVKTRDTCDLRFKLDRSCMRIVEQIENRIKNIDERNGLIFGKSHREKRAVLNIVGNLASDLFGVLDSKFADEYANDMKNLLKNDDHLLQLMRNQTSVIESSLSIAKKTDAELEKTKNQVNELFASAKIALDGFQAELHFNTAAIYLLQVIADYERQQDGILELLTDVNKNHVNHNLFTPGQIQKQIKIISEQVRNKHLVPEGNGLYRVIKVIPYVTQTQVIFKISIPLFKLDRFQIFKVITVPSIHKDELWWIENSYEFLMTSTNRQVFQLLTKAELSECVEYQTDTLVCNGPRQWKMNQIVNCCAWNLFSQHSNTGCTTAKGRLDTMFIKLETTNKWIFVIPKMAKLTIVCDGFTMNDELLGEGILNLNENCIIRDNYFQIDSHKTLSSNAMEIIVPKISHSLMNELHFKTLANMTHQSLQRNITILENKLDEIREGFTLNQELNGHDIHHYSLAYISIVSLTTAAILYLRYRIKNKKPIPAPRRISMPSIELGAENVSVTEHNV